MSRLLVFDFDGVICDSADECLVSSWIAYYHHYLPQPAPDRVPRTLRADFLRLRPFARSGEDYVLLQDLLRRGVAANSQEELDLQMERAGENARQRFRRLIYQVRDELLAGERDCWLGLNRIYPVFRRWLPRLATRPEFLILSTKRADLILEILAWNGFRMPPERVIDSGRRSKLEIVADLLGDSPAARALFVDDQIDHLLGAADPRIECRLAAWGYIQPEWLTRVDRVRPLSVQDLEQLLVRLDREADPGTSSPPAG